MGGQLIPVERKSRQLGSGAYEGELLQLAAYCLLVEERFGKPILTGQLQYSDRFVDVPFDGDLRAKLLAALEAVRAANSVEDSRTREISCCGKPTGG